MKKLNLDTSLLRKLGKIEDSIVMILLFSILFFAITQIVLRNFFDNGILWSESLLRILVLWLGLIGANIAARESTQINIDVLSKYLSEKKQHYIKILNNIFAFIICLIISYYSMKFVISEYSMGNYAFEKVPAWIAEAIIPVSFIIMAFKYLLKVMVLILNSDKQAI